MEGVGVLSDCQVTFIDPRNGLPMLLLYINHILPFNFVQYCETQLSSAININLVSSCGFVQYHLYIYNFHNHTKRTISKADLFKRISLLIETRVEQILGVL